MLYMTLLIIGLAASIVAANVYFGEDENGHSWYLRGSDDHHFTCSNCGSDDSGPKANIKCGGPPDA